MEDFSLNCWNRLMKSFLNISMVYRGVFWEITLFCIFMTIVVELKKLYKDERSIIGIGHLIYSDIPS